MSRFLASVNIFADKDQIDQVIEDLEKLDNIEEVYEVAGEYDIVTLVSAANMEEFRQMMHKQILKIAGVKSTIITVILHPHKGRRCEKKTTITSSTN